jgi:hypothetical protein
MSKSPSNVPQPTPVTEWPPEVQDALFQLIAFTVNEGATQIMFTVPAKTKDQKLGTFEIVVRRESE